MHAEGKFCLDVTVQDLKKAMKVLAKFEKSGKWAYLTFENAALILSVGGTSESMPASGSWPQPVSIRASTVAALAQKPPTAKTVTLRVLKDRFHVGEFRVPCKIEPSDADADADQVYDFDRRVDAAVTKLARYKIGRDRIVELAGRVRKKNVALWQGGDEGQLAIVAEVWQILAPLGIEACEIRRMMNQASREAFGAKGSAE